MAGRWIMRASGGSLDVLRQAAFGSRERERPMSRIAAYWRAAGARETDVDDRTWEDLDLDEVFAAVDHTASAVGQQLVYARLRAARFDATELARFDGAAERLAADATIRGEIARMLRRLDDTRALAVHGLFFGDLPARPAYWPIFPVLTLTAAGALALVDSHPRAWIALLGVAFVNVVLGLALGSTIEPVAAALHMTSELVRAARRIDKLRCAEIDEHLAVVRAHAPSLGRIRLTTGWLAFEPGQDNELVSMFYSYANLVLGLNLNAFAFGIEEIRRRRLQLRAVFEAIGAIDAACAVGSWRASRTDWSRPEWTARRQALCIEGVVHPLLDAPVANDLSVDGHSILVTGSNMSGKTTFIRAVGINAVLAQSINTVLATRWQAPPLDVRTSIGRSDDVLSGKSYYLAEVDSIGRLVTAARDGRQHLFLIDEIFRGTNTTERVAAGSAVLTWLDQGDNIVLVATHDLEVLGLLAGRYEAYHFREQVEHDQLSFDYRIRAGLSSTRNAIALLRLRRYPDALVQSAIERAARIDGAPHRSGGDQSPA